jgi:alkylation response protein AidB-like acyl-CoA dehydrogenase
MDLRDTPQEAEFRERVRTWLAENVPDDWKQVRGRQRGLSGINDPSERERALEFGKQWHRRLYDAGFVGLSWPKEYGGQGLSAVMQFIWQEEYSRAKPPPLINVIGLGWAGPAILLHGTEAQRRRYLPPILRGDEIWCQLFSEPNAGSDLAGLSTRAVRSNGEFIVNGQKVWTSIAKEAEFGILVARTDPDAPKHAGLSFLLVDMSSPGIEIRPIKQITGSAEFNEVFMTDLRVPSENLVGELNKGWMVTITTLMHERVGLSAGRGSLWGQGPDADDLVAHARKRVGDRVPADDPVVRQKLAQVYLEAVAHRGIKQRMITQADRGVMLGAEASVQKLFGDSWGQRLNALAIECEGLFSQIMEGDYSVDLGSWQGTFLYSMAMTIGGGTTEVQKNIIGERILGLPKDPATKQ